jgi:hypothetical protein
MKPFKSKFKVGDLVRFNNDFAFNPCEKVITVGYVEAIHFYNGYALTYSPAKGEKKPKSLKDLVKYQISGLSLIVEEKDLKRYSA